MTSEEIFLHNSYAQRGIVISEFSNMEKIIESTICAYFLDYNAGIDKISDFQLIITDRLTFEAKRTALRSIFERIEVKRGFRKTKNNSYPNSKFFDELRYLNDQRNYFAHYMMAFPFSENNSVISLAETRDKVKVIYYSKEDIENILLRISKAIDYIIVKTEEYRCGGLF